MTTLRVHFDGRVLVPEGPVDLPQGRSFEALIREIESTSLPEAQPRNRFAGERNGLPIIAVKPGTKMITPEDVRRAEEDD